MPEPMPPPGTPEDFLELLARRFDAGLSPDEERRMNERLRQDAGCRELFVQHCLHAQMIRKACATESAAASPSEAQAGGEESGRTDSARKSRRSTRRRRALEGRPSPWKFAVTAAGFLIGLVTLGVLLPSGDDRTHAAKAERPRPSEAPRAEPQAASEAEERKQAQAEAQRRAAEDRLQQIERKREELSRRPALPDANPGDEDRRRKEIEELRSEKERIEREMREAVELARKVGAPPQGEKPRGPQDPGEVRPEAKTPAEGTRVGVAKVERVEGEAYVLAPTGKVAAKGGEILLPGQGLETSGAESWAVLVYPDGTRIEVGGDTDLRELRADGGKRIYVAKGAVRAEVAKQPAGQPMVFATPHGEATVLGTTLRIVVESDPKKGTRLEVEKGKVQLKTLAGKTALVESGHFAVAATGVELAARRILRDALFVTDSMSLNASDQAVLKRLDRLGFRVTLKEASKLLLREDAQGKAVVILSSTISPSKEIPARELNSLAVPVLTWEFNLFPVLGMTGSKKGDFGADIELTRVRITNPTHVLAAGLSGAVPVTARPQGLKWGKVPPTAVTIAVPEDDPQKAVIFGYEAGAALATGKPAPERRVGFFMANESAASLTREGWALFDAAVHWAAEKQPVSAK